MICSHEPKNILRTGKQSQSACTLDVIGCVFHRWNVALFASNESNLEHGFQIANKKHSMNETFFSFCACQHAKPFISRHFQQSQAQEKITNHAEIFRQRGKESKASQDSTHPRSFPWDQMNEKREAREARQGKHSVAKEIHSPSQDKTLTREDLRLKQCITSIMPARTSSYGRMACGRGFRWSEA